jgi:hypothetical protein
MPKPDNEEFVVLGLGLFCPLRRYSQLVWFAKLLCSCLHWAKITASDVRVQRQDSA